MKVYYWNQWRRQGICSRALASQQYAQDRRANKVHGHSNCWFDSFKSGMHKELDRINKAYTLGYINKIGSSSDKPGDWTIGWSQFLVYGIRFGHINGAESSLSHPTVILKVTWRNIGPMSHEGKVCNRFVDRWRSGLNGNRWIHSREKWRGILPI